MDLGCQPGLMRLSGGGRIARERLGVYTPKKWERKKVQGGGGVSKQVRSERGFAKGMAGSSKLGKEEKEKLRQKKKGYKELIKRSKKWRTDRKSVKLNAEALREEMDAGTYDCASALPRKSDPPGVLRC